MNDHKMRYLKQNQTKVYNCVFQLDLIELRIFLRFPCKFFIQWKTTNDKKSRRTQGLLESCNGKVVLDIKLTLEVQMLHDDSKNIWIRKDSIINVFLVTKNKPDFSQLAGRINIDLSLVCGNNRYKDPLSQALTYSSTSADLKFSMCMKDCIRSGKSVAEVDLSEFNDRLYLIKQHDVLSKSRSLDYLKHNDNLVSPVYQVNVPADKQTQNATKPIHFPLSKLQSFGHDICLVQEQDNDDLNMRMTLGGQRKFSKQNYDQMIETQAQGMKKSNLIIVPDMRKCRVQEDDSSQFNTQLSKNTSQSQFKIQIQTPTLKSKIKAKDKNLKKQPSSEKHCQKRQNSPQSDVDIVVDLESNNVINNEISIRNSMNSSKSFSISRFKAQYQNSSQQNFHKMKSPKQSVTSEQIHSNLQNFALGKMQSEENKNKINQLQAKLSKLSKSLTDAKYKLQKSQCQKEIHFNQKKSLQQDKKQMKKTIAQLQQKIQYESKINSINCEKLKRVSSQLTFQRRKSNGQDPKITDQKEDVKQRLKNVTEKLKRVESQKVSLQEKLYRRDEIQLQNQVKIQQLEQELLSYRSLNTAQKNSPLALKIQSKITKESQCLIPSFDQQDKLKQHIIFLQEKLKEMELENLTIKWSLKNCPKRLQPDLKRNQQVLTTINVLQKQFRQVVKELLQKERLLKLTSAQNQALKNKFYTGENCKNNQKIQSVQEELKKKEQLLKFCENQITMLEQELAKTQRQNVLVSEIYSKLLRESSKYEGKLKVIKQQQSCRQSMGASGQAFSKSSLYLSSKQQNIINNYRQALQSHYVHKKVEEALQLHFPSQINELRVKMFQELDRSTKIINEVCIDNQILAQELIQVKEEKQNIKKNLQGKVNPLKLKIGQIQDFEKISVGSSGFNSSIKLLKPEQQTADRFSQITKKRHPLNLNAEAQLSRQVQKLKVIINGKNKQMSDLISSYEKLKIQKQTQSFLIRKGKANLSLTKQEDKQVQEIAQQHMVYDIIDLQIRLSKEKQHKNQIMEELKFRKSLNKGQQMSQYVQQLSCFDLSSVYKEIRSIISKRQGLINSQQTLQKLVNRMQHLPLNQQNVDKDCKLIYSVEQKARSISKEILKMKSVVFKMNFNHLQPNEYRNTFANIFKPCQTSLTQLLISVEEMVNHFG